MEGGVRTLHCCLPRIIDVLLEDALWWFAVSNGAEMRGITRGKENFQTHCEPGVAAPIKSGDA